jgi:hypothetical protein
VRYTWTLVRQSARLNETVVLTEVDGLCETEYKLLGGWQCRGNGMLTVLRGMLAAGFNLQEVKLVD